MIFINKEQRFIQFSYIFNIIQLLKCCHNLKLFHQLLEYLQDQQLQAEKIYQSKRSKQANKNLSLNKCQIQEMLIIFGMYRDYERQQKIDRMYLNQNLKDEYDKLNDDKALKLGTEFSLEILIYSILILVSSFEILKNYFEQQDRQQNMNNKIGVLQILKQNLQSQIKIIKESKLKNLNDLQKVYEIYEKNHQYFESQKDKATKQISKFHFEEMQKKNQDC